MTLRSSRGISRLEWMAVTVIVATLMAFLLPSLIDTQREVRRTKIKQMAANMRTAINLTHIRCNIDLATITSETAATCRNTRFPQVNMDGTLITMFHRYPTADMLGIATAAGLANDDGLKFHAEKNTLTVDVIGGTEPDCRLTYRATTTEATPEITSMFSGC
ncbi:MAG: hypothetical protein Q8O31_07875 [Rhodocyclaceae bacterium]|nr:hypothetical protein [Rhodocyclaceae bacterium]